MKRSLVGQLLTICLVAFIFAVQAENAVQTQTVTGEGRTRNAAIADALLQALARTNGLQIASSNREKMSNSIASVLKNGEEDNLDVFTERASKLINTKIRGRISSYDVVSTEKTGEGTWEAVVDVNIANYQTPGHKPDSRRKLAVLPFRSAQASYRVNNGSISGSKFATAVQRQLINELTQSRRFAMVDRDFDTAYAEEVRLIRSGNARVEELAKLGQALGVDYLLVGTVEKLFATSGSETVTITGKTRTFADAQVRINYRIIVMATRQIKWSGTEDVPFSTDILGDQDIYYNPTALADVIGKVIAEKITEAIFPIRVVSNNGGQILLNQGGTTVQEGEVFEVYNLGEMNYDPYTKEQLGRNETLVAVIRVQRVTPKLSYATVIQGNASDISQKSVCHRPTGEVQPAAEEGRETTIPVQPGGGVRLPFDR